MNKEFIEALDDLEKEKGIPKTQLLEAVEKALVSAYKGHKKSQEADVHAQIDPKTGEIEILHRRYVVEEVVDPTTEISLEEARQYDPDYMVGEAVEFPEPLADLGRIAAQTAKQVVVQTVRDIERDMIYNDFSGRQSELVNGTIQRVNNETVYVNLGKTEGIMSASEQVKGERYSVNSRLKFYIMDVRKSQKGPQVFLSRTHPGLVKRLFELEVPEISDGIVGIESLAREAGSRTKMAVCSKDDNVDPVGACVGNRGIRVQAVVDELFGEKIDIISWSDVAEDNISNALSPAKTEKIIVDETGVAATAIVPDYQLSLAIGKEGQNVRLAAKLCGIKIDIKSHSQYFGETQDNLVGELDEEGYLDPAEFIKSFESAAKPEKKSGGADDAADIANAANAANDEEDVVLADGATDEPVEATATDVVPVEPDDEPADGPAGAELGDED